MEKELPKNWIEVQLRDILDVLENGSRPKGGVQGILEGIPSLGGEHLNNDGGFKFGNLKFVPELFADKMKRGLINEKDILIVKDGATTGKTSFVDSYFPFEKAFVNEHVFIARTFSNLNSKAIFYFLRSKIGRDRLMENFTGSAQGGINQKFANNTSVPLPPLAEQNRIVDKLDRLFAQLEGIKSSMEKIPVLLKNFRQQVLTQAVISTDTIKLKKVLVDIKYGTSKKSDYEIIGTPILRIPNIDNGYINDSDLKFSVLDKKELETLKLKENDILIIRSNGSVTLVGQSAIVTKEFESYSYAGYLIRIRLNEQYDSKYLNYIFKSNFIRSQMIDTSRSTSGINNINSKEIQDLNIPNIKVEEQREIVSRIENLFSKANVIEEKYKNLKTKIETLPQTILHKAFKGELTKQLESDGDARDLLEEIMALKKKKL